MKYVYCIVLLAFISLAATGQNRRMPRVTRGERVEGNGGDMTEPTVRARDMNERMTQEIGNARWIRVIYRQLDLMKEKNAPLYYPVRPAGGQQNLFTTIFRLLCENKIKAYEYLDGYEVFDDARLVNLKDLLDRFYILYEEVPGTGGTELAYRVDESDVPSAEIRSYYVKEAWYFDQDNSSFDVKILAICPILTSVGDRGEITMPMFWLPYEHIRPYVCHTPVMTSNRNNAQVFTIDDYFRRRMFEGDIMKTRNLLNLPLRAYCPTPDSLENERERIEGELADFEKSLWLRPDTTREVMTGKAPGVKREDTSSLSDMKTSSAKESVAKANAPKTGKTVPARSVRRRR